MRLVIISDTHGRHEELGTLEGDVLIHCGDGCNGLTRDPRDVENLDAWFAEQRFSAILCTGGNHDFAVEQRRASRQPVFENARFLEDEAFEFEGVKFYGAPWTPELEGWAFYLEPERAEATWSSIPVDTDVLITHTPPAGILDANRSGRRCGCSHLRDRLADLRPSLHCFGHVHASAGSEHRDGVDFLNASIVGRGYRVENEPVVYDL